MIPRRTFLAGAALGALGGPLRAAGLLTEWSGPAAAPPIDLYTVGGDRFTLADLLGKVVLVNFWATWCEPCVAEMPSLQQLRDQLAPRLEVLGVNYQEGPVRIRTFAERTGIAFPIVRDTDGAVARAWGVRVFPASYVVDRSGQVKYRLVGAADWTSAGVLSRIRPLL